MSAFSMALILETRAATRDALIDLYLWANQQTYVADAALRDRAEEWAERIEAQGPEMVANVLKLTSAPPLTTYTPSQTR